MFLQLVRCKRFGTEGLLVQVWMGTSCCGGILGGGIEQFERELIFCWKTTVQGCEKRCNVLSVIRFCRQGALYELVEPV